MNDQIMMTAAALAASIAEMDKAEQVEALNYVREQLHAVSPFNNHPTDFTRWVKASDVVANDYNPNRVAKPEMRLLKKSIEADGVTMNIVVFHDRENGKYEVVDGFHRWTVLTKLMKLDYVPVSLIDKPLVDRMASTIRHNKARGKHEVDLTADMLRKTLDMGRTETQITDDWGMEGEGVLRIKQHGGIGSHYANQPHSKAWVRDTDDVVLTHG